MSNPPIIERAREAGIQIIDEHVERRLKVLQSTSASAIDRFAQCQRQWFGGYVEGIWAPQTEAQQRGTAIDLEVQRHYRGEPVHPGWREAVEGIVKLLPRKLIIQQKILLPTYEGGPTLVGYPDFLHEESEGHAIVDDLKSTSDYKYAKTAEELRTMIQPVTYSAWIWTLPGVKSVRARHVTAKFKKDESHPVGYRFMGARLSEVASMDRDHIAMQWSGLQLSIREMVEAAKSAPAFEALPATGALDLDEYGKSGCDRFGGCHFRSRCGLSTMGAKKMSNGPSLIDLLNQHKQQNGQAPNAQWPPAPAQPGPQSAPPPQAPLPGMSAAQPASAPGYNPSPAGAQVVNLGQALQQPPAVPPNANQPSQAQIPSANPNHAHPGQVGIDGYRPGQPCNGRGYYMNADGQGGIMVEPGHACAVCQPATVVPPDAPPRTSTPAEIQAVDEAKKSKRGRPKKSAQDPAELLKVYAELNEKKGFSLNEVERLLKEGLVEDALAGKITPGMLRQPSPTTSSASPLAPPPASGQAPPKGVAPPPPPSPETAQPTTAAGNTQETREAWYANSGPPPAQAGSLPIQEMPAPSTQPPGLLASTLTIEQVRSNPLYADAVKKADSMVDTQRAAARERVEQYVAQRRERPLKIPPTAPIILVDCVVSKATGALARMPMDATPLAEWLAPVAELAAKAAVDEQGRPAPAEDWRLVPFGRGRGLLAAAIRECLDSLPAVVLVDSTMSGADAFLECVAPHAALIVRGLR